jgi:hypothetical protein
LAINKDIYFLVNEKGNWRGQRKAETYGSGALRKRRDGKESDRSRRRRVARNRIAMMFGGGGDGEVLSGMGVMRAAAVLSPKSQAAMQAQAQWGDQETREFIAIRAEAEIDRDRGTAGNASKSSKRSKTTTLWELVSARMGERGYKRTPEQCKCKWKNLLNRYKVALSLSLLHVALMGITNFICEF